MPEFRTIDELESETIRTVHRYWNELRGNRRFPAKRDIDPAALKLVLPYIMIAEVHRDPLRVRYRLVGTEIVHFTGEDYTGRWLHDMGWGGEYIAGVEAKYLHMFDTSGPVFGVDFFVHRSDGQRRPYEWAIFPLADDGETVEFCLLVEDRQRLDRSEAPER